MKKLLLIIAVTALAQPALASSWNVSGLFDAVAPTANTTVATTNSNALPPMNTTYSTPGFGRTTIGSMIPIPFSRKLWPSSRRLF